MRNQEGKVRVAMVGNPNVGKTALLNALTGGNFTVGNFPGVTVEKKEGEGVIGGKKYVFVDLPGIYSFEAGSLDERVARDYIVDEHPDLIINVVNAANLERNLYLTMQLTDFGIPMILVLNMIDRARENGVEVDVKKLSDILGVPVVTTVAVRGEGIEDLKSEILKGGRIPRKFEGGIKEKIEAAEKIAREVTKFERKRIDLTESFDEVFMDSHLGIPIFFSFMWMVFVFTYSVAQPISDLLGEFFDDLASHIGGNSPLASLIGDGIIGGVGSVLVFVPNIAFLFLALSLLELSGYMPRAVYLLDGIMTRFGLNGRAIIPLIMGFGCNVPAVLATRSIEDDRVRIATVLVNPFMSCNARLPIYLFLAGVFFPKNGTAVIMMLYLTGVAIALISALALRKFLLKGESEFIMEMPPYMLPSLRDVLMMTWIRVKHFLQKAGTVILLMSVAVWFITTYPGGSIESSYAAYLGKTLQPVFSPMGWSWELVLSLITGFVAKEIVVSTLGVLKVDAAALSSMIAPHQAMAFMLFTLLYMPCLATIAAIRAEIGWKWAVFAVAYSFLVAYTIAFVVTEVGAWFF